jgi:predicted nuclease with TOPRIM domain
MDGVLKMAEENIENDFASSYKQMYEAAQKTIKDLEISVAAIKENLRVEKETVDKLSNRNKELEGEIEKEQNSTYKALEGYQNALKDIGERDSKLANQDFEIMALKARLYDYMK